MAYNLIVSYDLIPPGQNYDAVRKAIHELGDALQLQYSVFYVSTSLTPAQAYQHVWSVMDIRDRLLVVNAFGAVISEPEHVANAINRVWLANVA